MAKKSAKSNEAAVSDISKAIRMCVDSGKVEFGMESAKKHALHGQGKLIIAASNAPADQMADLQKYCRLSNLRLLVFDGDSRELGSLCGKPFLVSALYISEVGDSPILELVK